jgi:hypothetical protein
MDSKHKSSQFLSWRYAGFGISSLFLLTLVSCNSIPFTTGTSTPSPVASASPSPTDTSSPSPSPTNGTPSPSPSPNNTESKRESNTNSSSQQDSTRLRQARARQFTGSLNRLSRRYFARNNRFTGDLDELLKDVGGKPNSENYNFNLALIDEKKAVQTIVVAKREGLKSYTGLAYSNGSQARTIICESDRETQDKPSTPEISNNEAKCPSGYTQLNSGKPNQF